MGSKIFISYTRHDTAIADRLYCGLKEIGLDPWIDRMEIKHGESFLERMNDGLTEASYVLVLLSPASLNSRWVTREWLAALAADAIVLIPVLVDECEVPPLLRDIARFDLRSDPDRGIGEVIDFFRRELSPVVAQPSVTRGGDRTPVLGSTPRTLRLVALACMQPQHLEGFLFEADINPGDIGGVSQSEKITSLLTRVRRDGLMEEFALWLSREPSLGRCVALRLRQLAAEPTIDLSR